MDENGERASGVLMHPTSLAGGTIGDLGSQAYALVDWLADAGQSYWQILPLNAVDDGGSPYNALSALAGNPLLISIERLWRDGLLSAADANEPEVEAKRVDYARVVEWKTPLLRRAHLALRSGASPALSQEFEAYRAANASWLDDYALFRALRDAHGGQSWIEWEEPLRSRQPTALGRAAVTLEEEIRWRSFEQFVFDRQWSELRRYATSRGVKVIGDIPIFVAHDSADVWAHPELFDLDRNGRANHVSGVPPDYFSDTGQLWGNPLYRWDLLRDREYDWWVERFRRTLSWVDVIRVDHFRGFESYWAVPAGAETAVQGRWRKGPGAEFFRSVASQLGGLPIIAEDLGLITTEVEELRDELELPGMRVVQFAFDGDPQNPHLPGNYTRHSVAYTGTHDNDTISGWWHAASAAERAAALEHIDVDFAEPNWSFIAAVLESRSELAIIPMQDLLGLGSDARMNIPGTVGGNWGWRMAEASLTEELRARFRNVTEWTGRAPASRPGETIRRKGVAG